METQQFHLKWNNHSLNTLNSFQHLLDTCCLVDVSLTCASGKVVPAHRMVLAACSDYFYRLFKDLPEKHPVIVFKDASEQILNDLLEFMYRGEVEVDEANLSDFLKFADTLQVKGLSQGQDGTTTPPGGLKVAKEDDLRNGGSNGPLSVDSPMLALASTPLSGCATPTGNTTPRNTPPISVKDPSKLTNPVSLPLLPPVSSLSDSVANMNKAYHFTSALAAGLPPTAKFPNFFGLPNGDPVDIYSQLASPNLFNALKRKYPVSLGQKPGFPGVDHDAPVLKMPFLKDYFGGKSPMDLSESARVLAASGYPLPNLNCSKDDDDIAERSPAPSESDCTIGGGLDDSKSDHLSVSSDKLSTGSGPTGTTTTSSGGGGRRPQGRGSRLERMIAAEYKILSEYNPDSNGTPESLPAITPELMKSRRTHSLQLAIGEILHNRASVQSAATKYHIPRETLRRHYQRYLKAMGINKEPGTAPGTAGPRNGNGSAPGTPTKSSIETLAAAAAAAAAAGGADGAQAAAAAAYSSLLDIGQAYGIWGADDSSSGHDTSRGDGKDEGDLRIVEDDEDEDSNCDDKFKEAQEKLEEVSLSRSKGASPAPPPASSTPNPSAQPALPSQNNNNVAPEKPLTAPRPMAMEIA